MRVAVVGASNHPERYSYKAIRRLEQYGHEPLPVNPNETRVLEYPSVASLQSLTVSIDTVTVYISPQHQTALLEDLLQTQPRRVIFNPGSENPAIYPALQSAGIEVEEACTLVLLSTGQFE